MNILQRTFLRVIVAAVAVIGWGAILVAPTAANASIVYDVNRTIGAGTVIGFIETDGGLGALSVANITNWELTLTAPNLFGGSPDVIDFATQANLQILGTPVVATSTQLFFDFAIGQRLILQGSSPFNFWILDTGNATGAGPGEHIGFNTAGTTSAQTVTGQTGSVVIATVTSVPLSSVPLPPSLALYASALTGLGFMARRRRKRAA